MKMDLRKAVQWFAERMENKLRANDHKGHWGNCTNGYLLKRLDQELVELRKAVRAMKKEQNKPRHYHATHETLWRVIQEAADVANFAMMLADNAHREPRTMDFVVYGNTRTLGVFPDTNLASVCRKALRMAGYEDEDLEQCDVRCDEGKRVLVHEQTVYELSQRTPLHIQRPPGSGG